MKKRISACITLCGLLSCSLTIFGMQNQPKQPSPVAKVTNDNSANATSQPAQSFLDKADDVGEKILDHVKKADNVVYGVGHEILEDIKKEPKVLVGFMKLGGMNEQNAENTTGTVENVVDLVETAQDDVHQLIQDLGKAQISPQPTTSTTTK